MIDSSPEINFRAPVPSDGSAVFELVASCPPLDANSMYCNLLQCSHFSGTSVVAECQGEVVGFVSGYLVPERSNTLFIWQIAVGEKARGQGVATRMLEHILRRGLCRQVTHMETTITETNRLSWALFDAFASRLMADVNTSTVFDEAVHFKGSHDSEALVSIGPFNYVSASVDSAA